VPSAPGVAGGAEHAVRATLHGGDATEEEVPVRPAPHIETDLFQRGCDVG
jgi:hypothetical protein